MSWGTMLYWAENNEALGVGMPLWAIMPGVCIALLGGAFALLNYAFDEISNPALRPVRKAMRAGRGGFDAGMALDVSAVSSRRRRRRWAR
jgi:peptide/nickel transport system permease protein